MKVETSEFIKSKLSEQPKKHKFNENSHNMASGFPARGIISCNKSSTESLKDFVDFMWICN